MKYTRVIRSISGILVVALFVGVLLLLLPLMQVFAASDSANTVFMGLGYNLDDETVHNRTRLPCSVEDAPSITVFVHGQGGDASQCL